MSLLPKSVVETSWQREQVAVHEVPAEHAFVVTLGIHRRDVHVNSARAAFLSLVRSAPRTDRGPELALALA